MWDNQQLFKVSQIFYPKPPSPFVIWDRDDELGVTDSLAFDVPYDSNPSASPPHTSNISLARNPGHILHESYPMKSIDRSALERAFRVEMMEDISDILEEVKAKTPVGFVVDLEENRPANTTIMPKWTIPRIIGLGWAIWVPTILICVVVALALVFGVVLPLLLG